MDGFLFQRFPTIDQRTHCDGRDHDGSGLFHRRDFRNYLRIFLQQDVCQLSFGEGLSLQRCIEGHVQGGN